MRKTADIPIGDDGGRDAGKLFRITEMPSAQAEKWAIRVILAAFQSGVDVPEGMLGSGMAGLASLGPQIFFRIPFHQAEPLLDEMMQCVQLVPAPERSQHARATIPDDFEEVVTLTQLRVEVWNLHMGFFEPGSAWTSLRTMLVAAATSRNTNTSTSPPRSGRSSRPAKRR